MLQKYIAADRAQSTRLQRGNTIIPLIWFSFLWRYIRHKIRIRRDKLRRHSARYTTLRGPSVCATLDICSYAYKVCCTTHAWEQRVSHSSAQHAPELPHALYSANTYATTIRYSLYNAPWLPRRISDCGRKKRYPANPKPSRSTYAKSVFIRAWPDCEEQERRSLIIYKGKNRFAITYTHSCLPLNL